MIVADTGPLIAFAGIGFLELLRDVFGEVVIPPAIHEEFYRREQARRRWLGVPPYHRRTDAPAPRGHPPKAAA